MITVASGERTSYLLSPSLVKICFPQIVRSLAALLIVAPFAFAQSQTATAIAAGGCGPAAFHFEVTSDKRNHPTARPENGKALVYFIQDDTQFQSRPRPTTRVGIDGKWVGATQANSYFYVSVDPGEHHLCSSWQSFVGFGTGHTAAAASFTASEGQTYYFVARNSWQRELQKPAEIELQPVDEAEGQLLTSQFSFSISHPK